MIDVSHISKIVLPLLVPFQQKSVLFAGEASSLITNELSFSEPQHVSRFAREQLESCSPSELAVVSDLTETLPKTEAMAWLGLLKNKLAQHIVLIVDKQKSSKQNWQFADFLGLGFKLHYQDEHHQIFFYAIESYQIKKDWLNARFWANPENFDKYRW